MFNILHPNFERFQGRYGNWGDLNLMFRSNGGLIANEFGVYITRRAPVFHISFRSTSYTFDVSVTRTGQFNRNIVLSWWCLLNAGSQTLMFPTAINHVIRKMKTGLTPRFNSITFGTNPYEIRELRSI